ncbi:MAG: DUF6783 domain-containing protein [Blautia faecis]
MPAKWGVQIAGMLFQTGIRKTRLSNSLRRVFLMPVAHQSGHPVS